MPKALSIREALATVSLAILCPIESVAQNRVLPLVVPFERVAAPYIVIRVPVAGSMCEPLIFDTGTNTTVLGPALAARGGLSAGHATKVESLHRAGSPVKGQVRGIGFDGLPAGAIKVAVVADVSGLRRFGASIAGVYGHNWLAGSDYLIDYGAKRIVIGTAGTLPAPTDGHRTALTWAAGRPAVPAEIGAHTAEPFEARLVLDSGAGHLTLFGRAAERLALMADSDRTMMTASGFGARAVPTASATVTVGGLTRSVSVELRSDVKDREEDGLVPTSFFRSILVRTVEGLVVFDPPESALERTDRAAPCESWSNIQVDAVYVRDAATRARDGASQWLARPKCRTLFEEVKDQRGLPLATKLRALGTDPVRYLRMVRFLDGERSRACNRQGVLAFTPLGSRVVYLCGREFERAWRRDVAEAEATVIHELLHSLGAGENPPSPRAINYRIRQLCW